jgi:hypothetical protein
MLVDALKMTTFPETFTAHLKLKGHIVTLRLSIEKQDLCRLFDDA